MAKPLLEIPIIPTGRFIGLVLLVILAILAIRQMRAKKMPFIRRVAALDAIDDAVGRCTEMGRPVVVSYGIGDFSYSVIAALSILGYVAKICAETDTRLIVPTGGGHSSYVVRETAVDIVRSQYILAGKPETFREEDMPFLSGEQYAYTSGYTGILIRERPGATIMTGSHASEAVNIAEQSNLVGAITITSGTYVSNMAALACASDYIMLMDEQPAAGAYLSKNVDQIATIRVQDIYKALAMVLIVVGLVLMTVFKSDLILRLLDT